MSAILAIETSTDACSVALLRDGVMTERHVVQPRRHNQLLFPLLREVLESARIEPDDLDAIAYGEGPGSFTGLRIAASAVQGLCYASGIPAIGVSTLAAQAQRALREAVIDESATVLCVIDARIGEVYAAVYRFESGVATLAEGPWACAPGDLPCALDAPFVCVGDGARFVDDFPDSVRDQCVAHYPDLTPSACDVATLASLVLARGATTAAVDVQPVYVRDEIGWKKLAEQGRSA